MKRPIFGRSVGYAASTVLISLLLLTVLVLLNVGVSLLPASYTHLDSTYNGLYTLSEASEKQVKALDEDVSIYFLCDAGAEDATIRTFLDRYAGLSSHVSVKVIDPTENPTFTSGYTDTALSNYSVIIESDTRSLCIDYYDLFLWENEALGIMTAEEYVACMSDSYGSYILSYYSTVQHFNGESKITNGISYVTADRVPKIYAVSNHGETAPGSELLATLKANAYDVVTGFSPLAYGGIPEDCDLLLINAPMSDLSAEEAAWIGSYLDGGGRLLLTTAAGASYSPVSTTETDENGNEVTTTDGSAFPNLMALCARYGLSALNGVIVETDANLSYSSYPVVLLPNRNETHDITDGAAGSTMVFYTAHGIEIADDADGVTSLFTTSSSAYTSAIDAEDLYEKAENAEEGPFNLAVAAESGNGRLVWFASSYALDDSVDSLVSGGNHAYAVSACDWLTGQADALALPSVSLEEPMLIVTGNTVTLFAAFLCGVIPLSILLGGIFYRIKRRRA